VYPPPPGAVLSCKEGSYKILRALKAGGKGRTFVAKQLGGGGEKVLIKIPRLDAPKLQSVSLSRAELIHRYLGALNYELQALQRLPHLTEVARHIAFESQQFKLADGDIQLMVWQVMEFVDGWELADWCEEYHSFNGKFLGIRNLDCWMSLARGMSNTLEAIHLERVVHADLWYRNIMIRRGGAATEPKHVFIDFGQSWLLDRDLGHTAENARGSSADEEPSGKVLPYFYSHYAPERVDVPGKRGPISIESGSRWYATADIYSLGIVLLYLATGRNDLVPFKEYTADKSKPGRFIIQSKDLFSNRELKARVREWIQQNNPGLFLANPGVVDIVMHCLRPKVDERASDAADVLAVIENFDLSARSRRRATMGALASSALRVQKSIEELRPLKEGSKKSSLIAWLLQRDLGRIERQIKLLKHGALARRGNRLALINDLVSCLSLLNEGDKVYGSSRAPFGRRGMLGPTGAFSRC
jgi:serine/threonine protein kinase